MRTYRQSEHQNTRDNEERGGNEDGCGSGRASVLGHVSVDFSVLCRKLTLWRRGAMIPNMRFKLAQMALPEPRELVGKTSGV